MNDAASDITTGNICKFRFPVKKSLLFLDFLPFHPKNAPINADDSKKRAKTIQSLIAKVCLRFLKVKDDVDDDEEADMREDADSNKSGEELFIFRRVQQVVIQDHTVNQCKGILSERQHIYIWDQENMH